MDLAVGLVDCIDGVMDSVPHLPDGNDFLEHLNYRRTYKKGISGGLKGMTFRLVQCTS